MASRRVRAVWVGGLTALAFATGPTRAPAQTGGGVAAPGFYEAPGYYGTSFGVPSYGSVRGYSEFASPFGVGYGYGYAPSRILPGSLGTGLWRTGNPNPYETYSPSTTSYRTFALPFRPGAQPTAPAFGVYAPAYGPKPAYPPAAYFGR